MEPHHLPRIALVGGPDVDARLPLMRALQNRYEMLACGSEPGLAAAFSTAGFRYANYPLSRRVSPLTDHRSFTSLRERFRELRPDVVHCFDTKPGVFGCLAARSAGVPVVLSTITGLGALYSSHGLRTRLVRTAYEFLQRIACNRSDVTVFQNHDDERQLLAAGVVRPGRTAVILGSGVDTEIFAQARGDAATRARVRAELGIPGDAVVATMIARVTRTKGVLPFVAAAREVRARRPDAHFLLIGPDDRDSLDRLDERELAVLRANVTWPGRRDDVAAVLAASDLFVLPTAYREGIPRVLLEAAAAGLPLVTTDSPGCNEACAHEQNGLLVPVGDDSALTAAILRLVEDAELRTRFRRTSQDRARTLFDLKVVADQMDALWRRLLENRAQAAR